MKKLNIQYDFYCKNYDYYDENQRGGLHVIKNEGTYKTFYLVDNFYECVAYLFTEKERAILENLYYEVATIDLELLYEHAIDCYRRHNKITKKLMKENYI